MNEYIAFYLPLILAIAPIVFIHFGPRKFKITYCKAIKFMLILSLISIFAVAVFTMVFFSYMGFTIDYYMQYMQFATVLPVMLGFRKTYAKLKMQSIDELERGITSMNLGVARGQEAYFKSLSLPERETYLEEYRKTGEKMPNLLKATIFQLISAAFGYGIGYVITLII